MDEKSEGINSYSATKIPLSRSENRTWSDNDIRQLLSLPVFDYQLLLFKFSKTIRIKSSLRRVFKWTRLVERSKALQSQVRIDRKRTDIDEALRFSMFNESVN